MNTFSCGDYLKNGTYFLYKQFDKIDNFINTESDFLIAFSHCKTFMAPNTIIFENYKSGQFNHIKIEDNSISIDAHIIDKQLCEKYHSNFSYPVFEYNLLKQRITDFKQMYGAYFPSKSLYFLCDKSYETNFTTSFEKVFVSEVKIAHELFSQNLFEAVVGFKGKGMGLTPAGDDFVAGLLFGINYYEQLYNHNFNALKNKIIEITKTNNLFSSTMLEMAAYGKYYNRFLVFLNAFFYLNLSDIKPYLVSLFEVGHTSGADLLCGFLSILENKPKELFI